MPKTKREKQINFQSELCDMLMQKIHNDCVIASDGCSEKGYIRNYTRIKNNITHLRNELNELSKLLDNNWNW